MKAVYVSFPIQRGSRRFIVEKGRRWSLVEHALLDAVAIEEGSAKDLEERSDLPRRVVIEALIRLMRAGWVELVSVGSRLVFQATDDGRNRSQRDRLPAVTQTLASWRGFAIEQITGSAFRSRDLDIRPYHQLPQASDDQIAIELLHPQSPLPGDLDDILAAVQGDDELIIDIDRRPEKLVDRFAVVSVRGESIEGLPPRASFALRNLILARAEHALVASDRSASPTAAVAPQPIPNLQSLAPLESHLFEPEDVIIDGPTHVDALHRIIRNASDRLIIHSTFVADQAVADVYPLLVQASSRGVRIDLMWGQDDNASSSTSSSRQAAGRLMGKIASEGRADSIIVHPFSTHSHAKVIVADNGRGGWSGIVGSSNWLSSDLASFEVSLWLRDRYLIGELLRTLSRLSRGRPGVWHDFAIDLAMLSGRVGDGQQPRGRTAKMRLVVDSDHAALALEARDEAQTRIFALSHRLGLSATPVMILPSLAAARARNVVASFFYGRTTGVVTGAQAADLARELRTDGAKISPVARPRLHAKVLGWDDDDLTVTSMNWLSADPADVKTGKEIGVHVRSARIADNFYRLFQQARLD